MHSFVKRHIALFAAICYHVYVVRSSYREVRMVPRDLITVGDARERLGVSNHTIARLVREGVLKTYPSPLDKRQKLVDAAEVEALALQRPRRDEPVGKMLAAA